MIGVALLFPVYVVPNYEGGRSHEECLGRHGNMRVRVGVSFLWQIFKAKGPYISVLER